MADGKTLVQTFDCTHAFLQTRLVNGCNLLAQSHAGATQEAAVKDRMRGYIHTDQIGCKRDDANDGAVRIGNIVRNDDYRAHSALHMTLRRRQ